MLAWQRHCKQLVDTTSAEIVKSGFDDTACEVTTTFSRVGYPLPLLEFEITTRDGTGLKLVDGTIKGGEEGLFGILTIDCCANVK